MIETIKKLWEIELMKLDVCVQYWYIFVCLFGILGLILLIIYKRT